MRQLVIVPAYNESETIAGLIEELSSQLPEFDLLVVDDGSTDDTARLALHSARVVNLPFNLGIGGAMQTGYRYASLHDYDIAVQVDGDGQHPPEQVRHLVATLRQSEVDLVIGSRFLEPGHYCQHPTRTAGTYVLRTLLRWLVGRHITDCTSGFRAANRRVIRAFAQWYPQDYPEPEVILLLQRAGYKIEEVSVRMKPRTTGQSSIPWWRGMFYVLKVSVALLLDTVRRPWPMEKVNRP